MTDRRQAYYVPWCYRPAVNPQFKEEVGPKSNYWGPLYFSIACFKAHSLKISENLVQQNVFKIAKREFLWYYTFCAIFTYTRDHSETIELIDVKCCWGLFQTIRNSPLQSTCIKMNGSIFKNICHIFRFVFSNKHFVWRTESKYFEK